MKQSLMILSSLTTLALVNNVTLSSFNTIINTKLTSKTINVQTPTSLFNNTFGYLNQDSWITNQATSDNKYYSYDTRHAIGNLSDGTPTRNAFLVDDSGNLIIKPELKLSDIDKNTLNNIQSEMINHKKVTLVKDFYNPYSKSVYSDSYFTGDNSNWKYLQMGGAEKNINISKQQSANKVEYSNSLSETLGLYYIAKAVRDPNCIDMSVAENLGKYFISQSSLKNLDNGLTNTIINDIATNSDIYNIISSWPPKDGASNLYKNYAIDYIFDSSNNLIQVYSYKWNNTIISNINVTESNLDDSFWGPFGWYSNVITMVNWKQYASNWDDFISLYPKFNFFNSHLDAHNAVTNEWSINTNLSGNLVDIKSKAPSLSDINSAISCLDSSDYYKLQTETDDDSDDTWTNTALYIWHDDNNIFCQYDCLGMVGIHYSVGAGYDISLQNFNLYNVMK